MATIAELYQEQGRRAADSKRRSGDVTAQLFGNLANIVSSTAQGYAREREEAPIRAQEAQARGLQIQQAQGAVAAQKRAASDQTALDTAMSSGLDLATIEKALQDSGAGHLIPTVRKSWNEAETAATTLKATRVKADEAEKDYWGALAAGVQPHLGEQDGGMGAARIALQHAKQNGYADADSYLEQVQDPAHLKSMIDGLIAASPTYSKLAGESQDRALKQQQEQRAILTAQQTAANLAADNKRADAAATETARHNRATEAQAASSTPVSLGSLTTEDQAIVDAIKDYRQVLPSGIAITKGKWPAYLEAAHVQDPNFDQSQYQVRQKLKQSFSSGKDADNIRGLNTAVGHLGSLATAMNDMGNGDYETVNSAKNFLATKLPVTQGLVQRQGKQTKVRVDFNAVKGELAGIFKSNGATDQEIKSWESTLPKDPAAATPEERKAFIAGTVELMGSRMGANRQKYESGMGGRAFPQAMLSSHSRDILKGLGIDVKGIDTTAGDSATAGGGGRVYYDENGKPVTR